VKKLLFLTQYFPPEIGAPQNRIYELAVRLQKKGFKVTVLTAIPNYPQMEIMKAYKKQFYFFEEMDGLKVHRTYIFVRKSRSLFIRLLNYFSFVFTSMVIGSIKIKKQDFIFCESPPLFLGISALLLAKIKKAKLIFNVSDLWPESAEKLGLVTNKLLIRLSTKLEEYFYKKSFLIAGQTQGIVNNIKSRFPVKRVYWLKNGVDLSQFEYADCKTNWRKDNNFLSDDFLIFYGGIFGYAQNLEVIIYAADILRNKEKIKFVLIGTGPEKSNLIKLKNKLNLNNVFFFDPVSKVQIASILNIINAAAVPLKRIDLFKSAIPSKIFEVLASKKPILLGVEGEAEELFIKEGNCGLSFIPENADDLAEKILKLYQSPELAERLGFNGYNFVAQNFNRDKIAEELFEILNA
jgi:glycosyltransferase involved in cell wall biosynthesis